MVGRVGDVCAECHEIETVAPDGGSVHAPAESGDCTACHQPHGSSVAGFLHANPRPLCTSCHQEIEHELVAEEAHFPATEADGCLTCHSPHATPHPNLMRSDETALCTECHEGDSTEFKSRHLGLSAGALVCSGCHDPHASNTAGMFLPNLHPPFEDGDCSLCHQGSGGETP
jgi:predicted CXXCH cytochrome family protein